MSKESFKFKTNNNVVYFNLYNKNKSNDLTNIQNYDKLYHHWKNIVRADDPTKTLAHSALELCSRLVYAFGKNHNKPIFKSNDWFKNITQRNVRQTLNIRNQLNNIFVFKLHSKMLVNKEMLFNVFEISFTHDAFEILNLENHEKMSKNCRGVSKKLLEDKQKIAATYIIDKEKEESLRDYSSFSDNKENEELKISSSAASFLYKPALDEEKKTEKMELERKNDISKSVPKPDPVSSQSKFKEFKEQLDDDNLLKDFKAFESSYEVTESEKWIELECSNYFSDRITECNRLEQLKNVIKKIGIGLRIKHKGIHRREDIIIT